MFWLRNLSGGLTEIYGLFCEFVVPPERKIWLLFSGRDRSWVLVNSCFTKFAMVSFLSMACNQRYPTNIENTSTQNMYKTNRIIYKK